MSIHFKFKSAKEFDTISFGGTGIRVFDLKKAIVEKRNLTKGLDLDLVITDAQSGKVYDDENMQLPRNTSVTVKRIPCQTPGSGLLARMKAEASVAAAAAAAAAIATVTPSVSPALSAGTPAEGPPGNFTLSPDAPAQEAITMEDELAALESIHEQAEDMRGTRVGNKTWTASGGSNTQQSGHYNSTGLVGGRGGGRGPGFAPHAAGRGPAGGRGGNVNTVNNGMPGGNQQPMGGQPPANYVCYRCGTPGHFIQNCPTNGNPDYDQHKVKKKTGIPKSFMKPVSDPSEIPVGAGKTVVNAPWGGLAVIEPQNKNFSKLMAKSGGSATLDQFISNPPDHLACPICKRLMNDAVLIPCCEESACDECLRGALIERKLKCPLCSAENMSPEKLLANKVLRTSVDEFLRRARTENQEREKLMKEAEEKAIAKQQAEAANANRRTGDSADAILEIKKATKKMDEENQIDEFGGDIFGSVDDVDMAPAETKANAETVQPTDTAPPPAEPEKPTTDPKKSEDEANVQSENQSEPPSGPGSQSIQERIPQNVVHGPGGPPHAPWNMGPHGGGHPPIGGFPPHGMWFDGPGRGPPGPWFDGPPPPWFDRGGRGGRGGRGMPPPGYFDGPPPDYYGPPPGHPDYFGPPPPWFDGPRPMYGGRGMRFEGDRGGFAGRGPVREEFRRFPESTREGDREGFKKEKNEIREEQVQTEESTNDKLKSTENSRSRSTSRSRSRSHKRRRSISRSRSHTRRSQSRSPSYRATKYGRDQYDRRGSKDRKYRGSSHKSGKDNVRDSNSPKRHSHSNRKTEDENSKSQSSFLKSHSQEKNTKSTNSSSKLKDDTLQDIAAPAIDLGFLATGPDDQVDSESTDAEAPIERKPKSQKSSSRKSTDRSISKSRQSSSTRRSHQSADHSRERSRKSQKKSSRSRSLSRSRSRSRKRSHDSSKHRHHHSSGKNKREEGYSVSKRSVEKHRESSSTRQSAEKHRETSNTGRSSDKSDSLHNNDRHREHRYNERDHNERSKRSRSITDDKYNNVPKSKKHRSDDNGGHKSEGNSHTKGNKNGRIVLESPRNRNNSRSTHGRRDKRWNLNEEEIELKKTAKKMTSDKQQKKRSVLDRLGPAKA